MNGTSDLAADPGLPLVVSGVGSNANEIVAFVTGLLGSILDSRSIDAAELHKVVSAEDVNKVRTQLFDLINKSDALDRLYAARYGELLRRLLGPDVLVQRRYNVSIQLPGDRNSVLPVHSDCWSGDSPYQINFFFAVTDCVDGNAMFLCPFENSTALVERYQTGELGFDEMLSLAREQAAWQNLRAGELLAFNPAAFHGNETNNTTSTRISLNVRFKGKHTPYLADEIIDRQGDVYYREFFRSRIDREAERYVKALGAARKK